MFDPRKTAAEIVLPGFRLRLPVAGDAETIFARWAQDPDVTRYLTWRPHAHVDETRGFLRYVGLCRDHGTHALWIVDAGDGAIGTIGASFDSGVLLGYALARPWWGRGIMSAAVRAVVDVAFADRDVWRVWAVADVDNPASARVMQKAGMTFEGVLRKFIVHPNLGSTPRDVSCYAVVR